MARRRFKITRSAQIQDYIMLLVEDNLPHDKDDIRNFIEQKTGRPFLEIYSEGCLSGSLRYLVLQQKLLLLQYRDGIYIKPELPV